MSKELSREIRKMEKRLEGYLGEEERFVKELRKCIRKFKELNKDLERVKTGAGSKEVEELINLRVETVKVLCEALEKRSKAEHEKSHLLESYGALVLAMEKEFKDLLNRS